MEKYHKTDIAPVENENERDDTYQAVNPQIDFTRTQNNYNIIKRQRSYTQFINDKIEALDLPTKVRKDAVLMCSFVIGSDREFSVGCRRVSNNNSLWIAPASLQSDTARTTSSRQSYIWTRRLHICISI